MKKKNAGTTTDTTSIPEAAPTAEPVVVQNDLPGNNTMAAPTLETIMVQMMQAQQAQSAQMIASQEAMTTLISQLAVQNQAFVTLHEESQSLQAIRTGKIDAPGEPVYDENTIYLVDNRPEQLGQVLIYNEGLLPRVGQDFDIWIPPGCNAKSCTRSLELYNGLNATVAKTTETMTRTELFQYIGRRQLAMESGVADLSLEELREAVSKADHFQTNTPKISRTAIIDGATGQTVAEAIASEHGKAPAPSGIG